MQRYDAVILTGGTARRLEGADKAEVVVGGTTLLARAVDAVDGADRIVAVGASRPTARPVLWTREDPPFGGPAAALAAGVLPETAPLLAVLAVDMPFAVTAIPRLLSAVRTDGAILVDDAGRRQPLLAVYRTESVRRAVGAHPSMDGLSMRRLLAGLDLIAVEARGAEALDCDTHQQLSEADAEARRGAG